MTLKRELQAIDPDVMRTFAEGYDQKMQSLGEQGFAAIEDEAAAVITRYPALNVLVGIITDSFMESGYPTEAVIAAGAAASFAVGVFVEIAESQELPKID